MPVRYADVIKRDIKQEEPVSDSDISTTDKTSRKQTSANTQKTSHNYSLWEYSYFPYLVDMYYLIYTEWNPNLMYKFSKIIYNASSGEISNFLNEMSETQELAYLEYMIKRNNV